MGSHNSFSSGNKLQSGRNSTALLCFLAISTSYLQWTLSNIWQSSWQSRDAGVYKDLLHALKTLWHITARLISKHLRKRKRQKYMAMSSQGRGIWSTNIREVPLENLKRYPVPESDSWIWFPPLEQKFLQRYSVLARLHIKLCIPSETCKKSIAKCKNVAIQTILIR